MECHGIQEKLSAYLDDRLSIEEKALVEEHLRTCSNCSVALEDLKKTIAHTQGLEEVEPPTWLAQKVMARMREEAGQKKGILQKLFFPLHIKIPIEVIATIAVVVTAFYVFRTIGPEIKTAQAPTEEQVIVRSENDESIPEREKYKAAERSVLKQELQVPFEAHEPAKRKRLMKEYDISAGKMEQQKENAGLVEEAVIPEESYRDLDVEAEKGVRALAPGTLGILGLKKQVVSLTVHVKDIEIASSRIEKAVVEFGGKIIKTESFEDENVITAEIDSQKVKRLSEKLKLIGELEYKKVAFDTLEGNVKIKIAIIKTSMLLQ